MSKVWIREQPSLLDVLPMFDTGARGPRAAQIDRAYEKASQDVLDRYESAIRTFGSVVPDFIAGEVTAFYETKWKALTPVEKKALGGVYQRLMKRGVIVKTGGYRSRNQGNPSAIYKLKI